MDNSNVVYLCKKKIYFSHTLINSKLFYSKEKKKKELLHELLYFSSSRSFINFFINFLKNASTTIRSIVI